MDKKKLLIGVTASMTLVLAAAVMSNRGLLMKANANPTWRHYSALMPTASEKGIREYWTACDGSAPVFTDPGVPSIDTPFTAGLISDITGDPLDERVIPTLTEIQAGVSSGATGTKAFDYNNVMNAYAYKYLDATTKAQITGDASGVEVAKQVWESSFTVVWDAGKDRLPVNENPATIVESIGRGYDANYGSVMTVDTAEIPAGSSFEAYFYDFGNRTYGASDLLHIAVKSPFPSAANTSQTYWAGPHATAKKFNANPGTWTEIVATGSELNTNGAYATSLGGAISLQRYNNRNYLESFKGQYYFASIIAEKNGQEGGVVYSAAGEYLDKKTWGNDNATITTVQDEDYGTCKQISFADKTTVFESELTGFNMSKAKAYDYLVMHVYAPKRNTFYISQAKWRNNVLNVGVSATDSTNGAVAESLARRGAGTVEGWNTYVIPTKNMDATKGLFFEIWNFSSGEETWLVSSVYGYNDLNSKGAINVHGFVDAGYASKTTVTRTSAEGISQDVFKVTCLEHSADDRFDAYLPLLDLSDYTAIEIMVKAPKASSNFAVFYEKTIGETTGKWWPFEQPGVVGVTNTKFTTIRYNMADLKSDFTASRLRLGLLFMNTTGAVGDWYVAVAFVK